MIIKIRGFQAISNAGSGIYINGDVELDAENIYTERNGGDGLTINKPLSLIEKLGLPKETNPKELGELLTQLQGKNKDEATEIIKESDLLKGLSGVADVSDIASLIFAISTNPNVQSLIENLLK